MQPKHPRVALVQRSRAGLRYKLANRVRSARPVTGFRESEQPGNDKAEVYAGLGIEIADRPGQRLESVAALPLIGVHQSVSKLCHRHHYLKTHHRHRLEPDAEGRRWTVPAPFGDDVRGGAKRSLAPDAGRSWPEYRPQ